MTGVRVLSLASGSSGNALVIDAGATRLLIDAGISAMRIERGLAKVGLSAASLTGILVTHEHIDHIAGLSVLCRRHRLPVYMTRGTARAVTGLERVAIESIDSGGTFALGEAVVTAIPVRHDAAEPCGFQVKVGGMTLTHLTDFGAPDTHLVAPLAESDLIVIEANHDLDRLWNGHYAWPLKQRIASPTGHLCNDDCGALLAAAVGGDQQPTIWLAHLSEDNNDPVSAETTVRRELGNRPIDLTVLPRYAPSHPWLSPPIQPTHRQPHPSEATTTAATAAASQHSPGARQSPRGR